MACVAGPAGIYIYAYTMLSQVHNLCETGFVCIESLAGPNLARQGALNI